MADVFDYKIHGIVMWMVEGLYPTQPLVCTWGFS